MTGGPPAQKPAWAGGDMVVACADLASRSGAAGFEIGYVHEDVPAEDAGWYATSKYRGHRITVEEHRSPEGAALALAQRLLDRAQCRCGQTVALADGQRGCRWRLTGQRWEPGCDAPPVKLAAAMRGDIPGMRQAMNRAQRRRQRRH